MSSGLLVGPAKFGRVLQRPVHLMRKTGAVKEADQPEVGRARAHTDLGAIPVRDNSDVCPLKPV